MRLYHDYLRGLGAERIARAALYVQKGCTEPIEYYGLTGRKDLRMPWMFPKEYARESLSAEESGSLHVRDEGSSYGAGHLTLFVVRHGESTDNAGVDRYSGIRDCGLSDVGLEQARRVGRYLQSVGVQRIVASPMKRALSTAREIERLTGAPVVVDERLREMDFGRWEGLTREEVREKWASQFSGNRMNPIAVPIPGGEPAESVLARIRDFLDDVDASPARDGISRIALVTHNTLARILVGHCQGTPIENYRDIRIDNASVSKIRIGRGGVFRVLTSNQTEHLRE
jgi:broad specificity phosphatase PhoE